MQNYAVIMHYDLHLRALPGHGLPNPSNALSLRLHEVSKALGFQPPSLYFSCYLQGTTETGHDYKLRAPAGADFRRNSGIDPSRVDRP